MIIAIDGIDGSGKTTLANELSDRLNIPVFKPQESPLHGQAVSSSQAQDQIVLDLMETTGGDVIFDRFFFSEYAYGEAFNREYDFEWWTRMLQQFVNMPHLYIHCIADAELAKSRTDDEVSLDDLRRLEETYQKMYHNILNAYDLYGIWPRVNVGWARADNTLGENIEYNMLKIAEMRPHRDDVFMEIAKIAAKRGTCISRRNGAVLVSSTGHVMSTGYNGAPSGCEHPQECPRLRLGTKSGSSLAMCNDVHSELNCILQCASTGRNTAGSTMYTLMSPCTSCAQAIINAKVSRVVYERPYGDQNGIELLKEVGIAVEELKND